jgi:hypothetical protein
VATIEDPRTLEATEAWRESLYAAPELLPPRRFESQHDGADTNHVCSRRLIWEPRSFSSSDSRAPRMFRLRGALIFPMTRSWS